MINYLSLNVRMHGSETLIPRSSRVICRYSNDRLLLHFTITSTRMAEEVEIDIEQCERETQMMEGVKEFLKGGCKCSRGPKNGPCSSQFTGEEIIANLNNCHELSSRELDLVILANIQAVTRVEAVGQKRNRSPRCNFLFQSKPICRDMFLFMFGISDSRLRRLREHYENSGLSSRTHGNTRRLPKNTLPFAVVEDVKLFLANYAITPHPSITHPFWEEKI